MARGSQLVNALRALEPALRDLQSAVENAQGGVAGGADAEFVPFAEPAGGDGGGPTLKPGGDGDEESVESSGGGLALTRLNPIVTGIAAIAAVAAPGISRGLISASRGGNFEAGALSAINQQFARIPLLGELTGVAGGARIEEAVRGTIAEQIAEVRARGGDVTPEFERFLLQEGFEIERRREESRQQSELIIEELAANGATGQTRLTVSDIQKALLLTSVPGIIVNQLIESMGIEIYK